MYTALRTRTAGRWLMFCYCVFAMLFTLVPPSLAQSTYGTLRGTIRDQSQAVVPGATVTALNVDGNFSRTTISDESGNYEATLPVGEVRIAVDNRELEPQPQCPSRQLSFFHFTSPARLGGIPEDRDSKETRNRLGQEL